jgi:hypothetical protein
MVRPSVGVLKVGWWGMCYLLGLLGPDFPVFTCVPKKDRKPRAGSSGEKWLVCIVQCAFAAHTLHPTKSGKGTPLRDSF